MTNDERLEKLAEEYRPGRSDDRDDEILRSFARDDFKAGYRASEARVAKLVEAVDLYRRECENVAPDALYKRNLRERMFQALKEFSEG